MNIYLFLWHCPFKGLCNSFKKWPLTPRSIGWLRAVSYCALCAESISKNSIIPRRNLCKNRKYFNPLLSGQGRLELWKKQVENLVWMSLSKIDTARRFEIIRISRRKRNKPVRMMTKTGGRKCRRTVPLNIYHFHFHQSILISLKWSCILVVRLFVEASKGSSLLHVERKLLYWYAVLSSSIIGWYTVVAQEGFKPSFKCIPLYSTFREILCLLFNPPFSILHPTPLFLSPSIRLGVIRAVNLTKVYHNYPFICFASLHLSYTVLHTCPNLLYLFL